MKKRAGEMKKERDKRLERKRERSEQLKGSGEWSRQ